METITIKSSKDTDLSISILRPKVQSEKLAIICPGYLGSMNDLHLLSLADALSSIGYTAVSFDPTGTWSSGGDITDFKMSQYQEDMDSIKKYMIEKENYSDILLVGHSMGAYAALYYSSNNAGISSVVAIMSPYSMSKKTEKNEMWQQTGFRKSIRTDPITREDVIFNVPYSTLANAEMHILEDSIANIKVPKLFISGSKDTITPTQGVLDLYNLSNEPKEHINIEGFIHDYYGDQINEVNDQIINWIRRQKNLIVIVDAEDNILGYKNREEINNEKDIYRVSALWVTDKDGNILLAQRALTKKHHPGLFGPAVAGTVEQGETYEYNIQKEAEEELGLEDLDINKIKTEFNDGKYKHFTRWFKSKIDRDTQMSLREDEIASVRWFDPQELKRLLEDQPELFLESLKKHFEFFDQFKN
jgi:isopentenyl-diphosphate delta-isomerase